ncbi:MAG: hypothetical protein KF696_00485 [Planctomycetes bacterium]|nr:hypothetical protein [Planctomycetota bacterium]MCW8134584.1 hypothetical protein [Planctomycetota bacterium]
MHMVRLCMLLLALLAAGCATQSRPSRVGEVGLNSRYEAELAAEREARHFYDYKAPKTAAIFQSRPPGALVEWYNNDGIWVAVGNTPSREVVIEATGKPELFRVSLAGYLPQIKWIAATPGSSGVTVKFDLEPELPADRMIFRD